MNTKAKIGRFFAFTAMMLLPLSLLPMPNVMAQQPTGVSGHGEVFQGLRRTSFTAIQLPNGTVTGRALFFNTTTNDMLFLTDVTCIAIVDADIAGCDTVAVLGGVVTRAAFPNLVGTQQVFAVCDGGTGPDSQDLVSPLFQVTPSVTNPCTSTRAQDAVAQLLSPSSVVDKGQVTVRTP